MLNMKSGKNGLDNNEKKSYLQPVQITVVAIFPPSLVNHGLR